MKNPKKAPHGFKPIGNGMAGKPQTLQANKSKGARAVYFIRAASALAVVLPSVAVAPWAGPYRQKLLGWPLIPNVGTADGRKMWMHHPATHVGTPTPSFTA